MQQNTVEVGTRVCATTSGSTRRLRWRLGSAASSRTRRAGANPARLVAGFHQDRTTSMIASEALRCFRTIQISKRSYCARMDLASSLNPPEPNPILIHDYCCLPVNAGDAALVQPAWARPGDRLQGIPYTRFANFLHRDPVEIALSSIL